MNALPARRQNFQDRWTRFWRRFDSWFVLTITLVGGIGIGWAGSQLSNAIVFTNLMVQHTAEIERIRAEYDHRLIDANRALVQSAERAAVASEASAGVAQTAVENAVKK